MNLIRYFINSCIVTVIDVIIVWILNVGLNVPIVLANTIGVVVGFIIDYRLSSHFVFKEANSIRGFIVYLATFFIGLVLADTIIYISANKIFFAYEANICFVLSKGMSIVIPFFCLYFLRKVCYTYMQKNKN